MLTTPPLTVEAATGATAACSDGRRKRHRAGGAAGTGTEVGVEPVAGTALSVCPRVAGPTSRWTERKAGSIYEAIMAYERGEKVKGGGGRSWVGRTCHCDCVRARACACVCVCCG